MKPKKLLFTLSALALAFTFAFCAACGPAPDEADKEGPDTDVTQPTPDTDPDTENPDVETPDPEQPDPEPEFAPSSGYEGTVGETAFVLSDLGNSVGLHTELQTQYLKSRGYATVYKYATGNEELSHPIPVTFTWEVAGADEDTVYVLNVSESKDMTDSWTFATSELTLEVYNLKIATTYYWTVTVGADTSGAACFTTENLGPRNLYVDGVANVRDVGGYITESGVRTKQGLLFRTGRLSENYNGGITITEQGINTMLNVLKVKTEIDLRGGSDDPSESAPKGVSALGDAVTYYHFGMNWDGNIYTLNPTQIRDVFTVLADPDNYPIFFHCSIGTDRTGLIAYILNGLLGVAEEDIYRDYLFSNFANISGTRDLSNIRNTYVATINLYEGDTLSEKCRSALLDLGVTAAQIDNIIKIFTA